jgi:predicted secreted hydrolase
MAHLAITDVGRQRFRFADRINRAGPGWAGASMDTYRVWNEGWEVRREGDGRHRLTASTDAFGIDLDLEEGRAAVRHGEQGYSRKGGAAGNASFYYSLTRMPTRGRLALDGQSIEVSGSSWMDHEFGTTFLEKDQVGWDWFSLQFDDGRDLMVFQLRRRDGSIDPRSSGTLVEPDGRVRHITAGRGLTLQPGRAWTSPTSGARYPVEWRVRVPDASMDVIVTAAVQGQELQTGQSTGVTYWEGAVDAAGTIGGKRVNGRGYLEMTGYAAERGLEALQ